jgi:hypothetical protein
MRGFLHLLFAVFAGIATGWISAVSLIQNYGFEAVAANPQWKERLSASNHPAAPYAFGFFINEGRVPPPLTSRHFVRTTDEQASLIRNECTYLLAGKIPPSRHWSVAISTADATLASLGAGETVYEPDGSIKIYLAAQPVPGNRLVMPPSGSIGLSLTVHDPKASDGPLQLPTLTRVGC